MSTEMFTLPFVKGLVEETETKKEPTEASRLKLAQARETIALKTRQNAAMSSAQMRDLQKKSREQEQKINKPKVNESFDVRKMFGLN